MSKVFVCRCEDITVEEVEDAIERGYTDLESMRRYTGLGTGPCQGKACLTEGICLLAQRLHVNPADVGVMTFRPPARPVPLGAVAAGIEVPKPEGAPRPGAPDRAPVPDQAEAPLRGPLRPEVER